MKSISIKIGFLIVALILTIHTGKALSNIISVSPLINSHSLPANGNITAVFVSDINVTTLNNETVIIDGSQSGRIHSTIYYNSSTRTATIDPDRDLKPGEWIHVWFTSGIQTLNGISIQPYSYNFKVKPIGGNGDFSEILTSQLGTNISLSGMGDFDGDGDIDILVKSSQGSAVNLFIYKNDGSGIFNDSSAKCNIEPGIGGFIIADFDKDGDLDAAGIESSWYLGIIARIYMNDGTGVFSYFSDFSHYRGKALEVGDIDNDEDIDFVMLTDHSIITFLNRGDGFINYNSSYEIGCVYYFYTNGSIALDDFDADNDLDIYYLGHFREEEPGYNCWEARCYLNNGHGSFSRYNLGQIYEPSGFITEDLNNDRLIDLIMPPYRVIYYYSFLNFTSAPYPGSATTGDFDGDGDIDLVIPGAVNTQPVIYYNDGNGNFSSSSFFVTEGQGGGFPCADFDNDGDLDILKSDNQSGEILICKNSSSCLINGPSVIDINSDMTLFYCSETEGYWTLVNNPLCNASIAGDNTGDSIFVNAGNSEGIFTLNFYQTDSILRCSKIVSVDDPLPVELSSFTGSVSGRDVILNWSTHSENLNQGFEIERSFSNNQWEKIGFIKSKGSVNMQNEYSYHDKKLQTGKYKYRLKQLDLNGNHEYFELDKVIVIGIPSEFSISQNYPNPFNPVTKIDYSIPVDGNTSLILYDINGREVRKLSSEFKSAGYYTYTLNATDLSSGVYFYRLKLNAEGKANEFIAVKKMIFIK